MKVKKNINEINKIKKILYLIKDKRSNCYKCGNKDFFINKDFTSICNKCTTKTFITKDTIFHNVRFGLKKAFDICIFYYNNKTITSVEVSKKFGITQKTAYYFLKKIKTETEFIKLMNEYKNVSYITLDNHLKLKISNRL